jgi:ferredoxin-fold anticodon binding domain-containing protein
MQLKVRGIRVKADEDEVDAGSERLMYIDLEIFNKQGVKPIVIVDAVRQIEGVLSVNIVLIPEGKFLNQTGFFLKCGIPNICIIACSMITLKRKKGEDSVW